MSQPTQSGAGRNSSFLGVAEGLVGSVGRFGYGLVSFWLSALPPRSRQHAHKAIEELWRGIASIPGGYAAAASKEIDRWVAGSEEQPSPGFVRRAVRVDEWVEEQVTVTVTESVATPKSAEPPAAAGATTGGIQIAYIEFDPPGRDVNGEYVLIRNTSGQILDLSNWLLVDGNVRHTFVFPTFKLAPGKEVKIWTRTGINDAANLYWGSKTAIWNNEGDTATLSNTHGTIISRYSYKGKA